jgi:hypothetical protein
LDAGKKVVVGRRLLRGVLNEFFSDSRAQVNRTAQLLAEGIALPKSSNTLAGGSFADGRTELTRQVGESAKKALSAFNESEVSARVAERLREAAVQVAALEIGALGLAGIVGAAVLDVTGERFSQTCFFGN